MNREPQADAIALPKPGRPVLAAVPPAQVVPLDRLPQRGWPAYDDMLARLDVLQRAPVFFALREATLRALARRVRRIHVAAGEMVVFQDEPGDTVFFIEDGRCRLVIEKPPSEVTVAVLTRGDFFGEAATLLNRPQQASVYAQSECILLALDRQGLQAVLGGKDGAVLDELRKFAHQRFQAFADTALQATWGALLREATVVGVYSPKGGSGGTCISLNLVGALSRTYPGQVLLLDLDFPYSHAALLAGLIPTTCLARMTDVPAGAFEEVLLSAVLYHAGGPMILPGALRPEEGDAVTPALIARSISVLRKSFSYIVVDLGVTLTDSTLALLDLTQHLVLVVAPELSALKSAADAIDVFQQLGMPEDRLSVVLNNRAPRPAVTRPAVERKLQRRVDIEVGFDGMKPEQAAVDGAILSVVDPKSEVTKGANALAGLIDAVHGRRASGSKRRAAPQ
jgi:Flp pilus assembly CpaE family ATPase